MVHTRPFEGPSYKSLVNPGLRVLGLLGPTSTGVGDSVQDRCVSRKDGEHSLPGAPDAHAEMGLRPPELEVTLRPSESGSGQREVRARGGATTTL